MGKHSRAKAERRMGFEKATAWTDPRRFLQIEKARNPTLGAQKKVYQMVLRDQIKPGHKVLEIGAGRGWFQKHIVPEELRAEWTELEADEKARGQSPGKTKVGGDLKRLPFKDGAFDAVVESSTLDLFHPDEHGKIVAEMGRVLKPGGKVISFQDGLPNPALWLKKVPMSQIMPGHHTQEGLTANMEAASDAHDRFSKAMAESLEKGGFKIVARQPIHADGVFPEEERHRDHPEPNVPESKEMKEAKIKAPMHMYMDGFYMPANVRPGMEHMVPPGTKGEVFRGRVIVAEKKVGP